MHLGSPSDLSQTAVAEAKPRYVYSILKPHGQSSKSPIRLLPPEAKPSYIYSILKPHVGSFNNHVDKKRGEGVSQMSMIVHTREGGGLKFSKFVHV